MTDTGLDFQKLLTDTLQKQMAILGSQITLMKAHNVDGLTVSDDGKVTAISGDPKAVSIKLLEQFRELSPLMVKKTMQPLLSTIIASYPHAPAQQTAQHPDAKPAEQTHEEHSKTKIETKPELQDAN